MDLKKVLRITALTIIVSSSILTFSETFSRYTFTKSGVAWTIDFTTYKLLESVHVITESRVNSGKLYGAEGAFKIPSAEELLNMTEEEYNVIIENILFSNSNLNKDSLPTYQEVHTDANNDGKSDAYDEFMNVLNSNFTDTNKTPSNYEGHYYFPQAEFNKYLNDGKFSENPYAIKNIDDVVFNVANESGEPLLVCFNIYYYNGKASDKENSVSFSLYNTTIRGDKLDYNNQYTLKGEFPIKNDNGITYFKAQIPNVIGHRTGGGCEVVDPNDKPWYDFWGNGKEYYPCVGFINPFNIKEDPILTQAKLEAYFGTLAGFNSGETVLASEMKINYNLNDFVIPSTGEIYSFNLSLFYGSTFGTNTGDGYAFLAGIEMYTVPITDEIQTQLNIDKSLG